ncbi:MAG: YfhO family protein [Candidatus Kapabacteria bacterium]|nr:YfhO family protein [Candidatus Kapabacteria bacterium]
MTFLIPNYYGFGNTAVKTPGQVKEQRTNLYWGQMPFTDAANYMGIGVLLLAIIGAWNYRKDPFVIFLIALSVFSLLLSFGKNMPLLYKFFYDVVPAFNKFRAPSMALCLLQFAAPVLAGYGITSVFSWASTSSAQAKRKGLIVGVASLAVFAVMFLISSDEGDYKQLVNDAVMAKQGQKAGESVSPQFLQLVYNEMKSDATTSGLVLLAFGGLILLVARGTIKPNVAVALFLLLLIGDLWRVDKRPYEPKKGSPEKNIFAKTDVVDFIKQDAGVFRICDLSSSPTPNWWAYHFIENVHGYSSAKMRVYQDLLDVAAPGPGREATPGNSMVLNPYLWNLLNVKYIVSSQPLYQGVEPVFRSQQNGTMVYVNGDVLPRAWFVDTVRVESNKRTLLEMLRDGKFDVRTTAFVESEFAGRTSLGSDPLATARIIAKSNQHLGISTTSASRQLLVVSEVYYDEWHAYVDGNEVPMLKADFVLRGVDVPSGKHNVEFRYISNSFEQGRAISLASNAAAILIGLSGFGLWYRRRKADGAA